MFGLSERIIRNLTDITTLEGTPLPQWIDKKYIASCIIPPLSGENNVHCNIAVVAPVSAGKSTLFNSLCGYPILPVASKTTSSVPTYITRISEQSRESVTVYGIKKEVSQEDGFTSTRFIKDVHTRRTFSAKDISKDMFNELFEYMYFVTHGVSIKDNEYEYMTTVENVAYFMKDPNKADILFNGLDAQKWTISKEDFALTYDNPRHRLLLLLILLCVYVNQNDNERDMGKYTKEVNQQRKKLFQKYKFPTSSDYCVCLDWCNDDIPHNVTLIDLPGTGASTQDTATQSSHTALVRGILTEADAVWVLCSDNGAVDMDLLYALKDTIEGNSRKNKVCIYNCKNRRPNDSGPVIDFLKKLPCLTGERCYVVDALAGEYKYIQNGVSALMTKTASDKRCNDYDEPTESEMTNRLEVMYKGEKRAYCTFTTSRDGLDNIIAVQDSTLRYTLDSFFKSALADYIERLKYEVALAEAITQSKFFIYIRDSLSSSRGILEGIDGKGEEISKAVTEALEIAMRQSINKYVQQTAETQANLEAELKILGDNIGEKIKAKFVSALSALIENIKAEWRTLEQEGNPNCLKANFWGNYPLKESHENWDKFKRVRKNAQSKVTISAFDGALVVADTEIKKYNTLLNNYTSNLKKITHDFMNNYINAFLSSFDKKRDELCEADGNKVTNKIYLNFNSTREKLKKALEDKLNAMCVMVCDSFDILTEKNGIFDTLCKETDQTFRDKFCENILDKIREFMYKTFTDANYIGFFVDRLTPEDLHKLLNDDFTRIKAEYTESLAKLIDIIYSIMPGETSESGGDANFPSSLSTMMYQFGQDKIANGAKPEIENMHSNISSLIGFGASVVVDLTSQIKELDDAIATWTGIGEHYKKIYAILEDSEVENTKRLYGDCKTQIDAIVSGSKN
ncbi:MAG: dynamin family protein [Roseburia sp.]|nr:dynamin family protein [Roseburia sp.]